MEEGRRIYLDNKKKSDRKKDLYSWLPNDFGDSLDERIKDFDRNYRAAFGELDKDSPMYRYMLLQSAYETRLDPSLKNNVSGALGYFQMIPQYTRYYSGVPSDEFLNNPIVQFRGNKKQLKDFRKALKDSDISRAKELGINEAALVAGCMFCGLGNVRKYIFDGIDFESGGLKLSEQIQRFNKDF